MQSRVIEIPFPWTDSPSGWHWSSASSSTQQEIPGGIPEPCGLLEGVSFFRLPLHLLGCSCLQQQQLHVACFCPDRGMEQGRRTPF